VPVNPAIGRLRQEDFEFQTNLGDIVRTCFTHQKAAVLRLRYNTIAIEDKNYASPQ
jgi:hypothetical protein